MTDSAALGYQAHPAALIPRQFRSLLLLMICAVLLLAYCIAPSRPRTEQSWSEDETNAKPNSSTAEPWFSLK